MQFNEFPKIPRYSRPCVITEKIDGTNASILIEHDGLVTARDSHWVAKRDGFHVAVGSRTRWITPQDDHYGFAKWVVANQEELLTLGPGHHFGEWWGQGIQRGYGLTEKRFSLFNTSRWNEETKPVCCHVVPVLFRGPFDTQYVESCISELRRLGSRAAPGFMKPEGIVIFHTAGNLMFKKTLEKDEEPKGMNR